jgi:hypothetical protein
VPTLEILKPVNPVYLHACKQAESLGHETVKHHKYRSHEPKNATDTEILLDEGADLPHATHAGHVDLPGAVDS